MVWASLHSCEQRFLKHSPRKWWSWRMNGCQGLVLALLQQQIAPSLTEMYHYGCSACPFARCVDNGAPSRLPLRRPTAVNQKNVSALPARCNDDTLSCLRNEFSPKLRSWLGTLSCLHSNSISTPLFSFLPFFLSWCGLFWHFNTMSLPTSWMHWLLSPPLHLFVWSCTGATFSCTQSAVALG